MDIYTISVYYDVYFNCITYISHGNQPCSTLKSYFKAKTDANVFVVSKQTH